MNKLAPEIIYEDEDVVVINKPFGVRVHEDGYGKGDTVADWMLSKYPQSKNVGAGTELEGKINRSGVVHRLDKDTSGVMILAKNKPVFDFLKDQFKNRQVEKVYMALVYGQMKLKEERVINLPIGRSNRDPRMRVASNKAFGKIRLAETSYRPIEIFKDFTLVEAKPKTGRTHQVRVHLKAIQYPIVCDHLYAKGRACLEGLSRQALHAYQLTISLPSGIKKTFTAPLPEDIQVTLDKLRSA